MNKMELFSYCFYPPNSKIKPQLQVQAQLSIGLPVCCTQETTITLTDLFTAKYLHKVMFRNIFSTNLTNIVQTIQYKDHRQKKPCTATPHGSHVSQKRHSFIKHFNNYKMSFYHYNTTMNLENQFA